MKRTKSERTIVCLCGSTRFWEAFRDEGLRLTLEGKIVLSIGIAAPDSMTFAHADSDDGKRVKADLDQLHFDKIRLADEIFVLNKNGYVGESTRNEIALAILLNKQIRWLEPRAGKTLLDSDTHDFGLRIARHMGA